MTDTAIDTSHYLPWSAGPVVVDLVIGAGGPVRVLGLRPATLAPAWQPALGPADPIRCGVPLVEIDCLGEGRVGNSAAAQHRPYAVSERLRYTGHRTTSAPDGDRLELNQRDDVTGLEIRTRLWRVTGTAVLRVTHDVLATGPEPVVLSYLATAALTGFAPAGGGFADLTLYQADHAWCAELRWQARTTEQAGLVDNGETGADEGVATSRGRYAVTCVGSWSSGGFLPMGAVRRAEPATAWVWQIEHPGSWHWELGDLRQDLYLLVSGPTEQEHQWRQPLSSGERFSTVPVAIAVTPGELADGLRELTAYRRSTRRQSADNAALPIIFNDYMNCLMGDPSEARLAPLIAAAAEVGCEYFVIDAGWYADNAGWWDTVGDWQPSTVRFPSGLPATLRRISDAGMAPGLWLEPEVVGVHSAIARKLPDDAFFQRGGRRIAENGRYHLDFRCDAVRAQLDGVVDRLVGEYGARYLKLDYNVNLSGTDVAAASPGAGLLGHGRAYLDWLDGVLDRHPDLVLENCASGGMRMDHALLSRLSLQSTSDQRDHLRYATIAAAAPSAVTPEQGAVWACPQPGHSPEEASFSLVNALLGRVHLSGRLDAMSVQQRQRVGAALDVYRSHRRLLATGLPYWPLGLPGWRDRWVALAVASETDCLLAVWCRDPDGGAQELRLPWLAGDGEAWECAVAFPTDLPHDLDWSPTEETLRLALPAGPAARLLRLRRRA